MKQIIPCFYMEYGRYINRFRAMPYMIDALKPVERRLLLSLYEVARDKEVKSATVIGHCMGNYHPHGSDAIYGSLVDTLATNNMIDVQGNWGSYGLKDDNPAAAMRYTECKLHPLIRDLAFKYIKYVEYENVEFNDEPKVLPCPVPLGLIGYDINWGITFSHIKVPRYTISDLAKRLYWLLTRDENNKKDVGPIIKPNFRNCSVKDKISDNDSEFLKLLTTGKATLTVTPHGKLNNDSIEIRGRVPGSSFDSLLNATVKRKTKNGKDIPIKLYANLIDNCGDKDNRYNINILVEPKDIKDIKNLASYIWKEFLIKNINFNCLFYDDEGKLLDYGIDNILINNYNYWLWAKLNKRLKDLEIKNKLKFENVGLQIIRAILVANPNVKTIQEIINLFNKNKKASQTCELDFYDSNNQTWTKHTIEYKEDDIRNIIKNKSIKQLIENEIDLKHIENEINISINKINNINTDGQNVIKNLI